MRLWISRFLWGASQDVLERLGVAALTSGRFVHPIPDLSHPNCCKSMVDPNLEDLASRCLQRMQDEGQQVLEEICAEHQEHAQEIRGMVEQLLRLGLMDGPQEEDPEQVGKYKILRRLGGGVCASSIWQCRRASGDR